MSFILIKFADNVFNILSVQKLKFGIDLSVIKWKSGQFTPIIN